MNIIIKKHSDSARFKPHYNSSLGKYYHTKEDYLGDMKKGGFEPYTGEAPKPKRTMPDTRGSEECIRAIQNCTNKDGSFTPGSVLTKELIDRGVITTKDNIEKMKNKVENFKGDGYGRI